MIRHLRSVLTILLLASLALPISTAHAQQEQKTVAVMSISSVDRILGNVNYLTEAAGSPDYGQFVSMMSAAYLEGIDRGNPIGMVLHTDGQNFSPLGFIPVKDLDKVFASLEDSLGAPRDAGNGIKEIPLFQPIFIKEQGGYAFVGQTVESMASLPANPAAELGNLPKEYDFALRGFVQNIPQVYLDMAIQGLQQGVKQGIEQLPEEDQEQQRRLIEVQLQQMETYIKESDQLTIGWKTEPENKRTFIDITFSAIPGGSLAKQMNAMATATSDYTGFLLPDAAVSMNFTGQIPPEQIQTGVDAIEGMKAAALKEIERDESLEEKGTREAAKEMLSAAIDIFIETLKTGKMDGAASVVLESGNIQMLGGFHVADGKSVEQILRRVADLAKDEPKFPGIKFNADKIGSVTFHTLDMPVPADEEDARKIIGDQLSMAVGVGPTSAYIGFGHDCVNHLKQVIGKQTKNQKALPFELTVALAPIMEFASNVDDNPAINSIADALKANDKDHVRLSVRPLKNGFTYRIELEEGILQAIGTGIRMSSNGGF